MDNYYQSHIDYHLRRAIREMIENTRVRLDTIPPQWQDTGVWTSNAVLRVTVWRYDDRDESSIRQTNIVINQNTIDAPLLEKIDSDFTEWFTKIKEGIVANG